jgi:glycosyltransferase involved in cell wall biosynthesis
MNRPTLALCIPAYKAEKFLPRLLESARKQAIPFDEIIVCVDCSPDRSAEVARSYGATVIENERNLGCSASKNRAMEAATSDWIHFHDADDLLLPNFTQLASRWAIRPDCPDVVLFDYEYRDHDTEELIASSDFSPTLLRQDPLRYAILHQINPFCGLYRRAKLLDVGGYDIDAEILYNEDVAFHCKLAAAGLSFSAEKEVSIVNYRVSGSMSGTNQVRCLKAHHALMRRMAAMAGDRYGAEISSRLWAAATGLAVHDEWDEADQALDLASRLCAQAPHGQSRIFRSLCRVLGAKRGFRVRESLIRRFKPQLRQSL